MTIAEISRPDAHVDALYLPVKGPLPTMSGLVYDSRESGRTPNNTLAFNLKSEWDRAAEGGEGYRRTFIDNSHFYAGETYIKGRATTYEYKVSSGGRLVYPNTNIDAIESFQKPTTDNNRPPWLRERDGKDLQIVKSISAQLPDAKVGTTWIAASPSIPDSAVAMSDKEKWGYGRHSFLFLHQVQQVQIDPDTIEKKLVCRALRHYLPHDAQSELIEALSGKPIPEGEDLHGFVATLSPKITPKNFAVQDSLHIAQIHSIGKKVADKRGAMYWQDETAYDLKDIEQEEARVMSEMQNIDWWLNDVYTDILHLGNSPTLSALQAIENKFKGWESAVRKIASGEKLGESLLNYQPTKANNQLWRQTIDQADPRLQYIRMAMHMQGGIGTCGVGSGFGNIMPGTITQESISTFGIHGLMGMWSGLAIGSSFGEYKKETFTHYESYQCPNPKCKAWLPGERKDGKNWKTNCPKCNEEVRCN